MRLDSRCSGLKNPRSTRWVGVLRVRRPAAGTRNRRGGGRSFSVWNDNKEAPYPWGGIMQGTDLSVPPKCPTKVSHPLRGMALGTLAEIAVRLVISSYIFAVVVYVNASGNWDKDDDLGTRGSNTNRLHERSKLTTSLTRVSDTSSFRTCPKITSYSGSLGGNFS